MAKFAKEWLDMARWCGWWVDSVAIRVGIQVALDGDTLKEEVGKVAIPAHVDRDIRSCEAHMKGSHLYG